MIGDKKLNQEGGDGSTNLQAHEIHIYNNGVSPERAEAIALKVFEDNFIKMSQNAAVIVEDRVKKFTKDFIEELRNTKPENMSLIEDPDVQYALFSAQKEYAKSGEKELEDMLINILSERLNRNSDQMKKIVLNEALQIVPKLTNKQLDTLTLVFLTQETVNYTILNRMQFAKYFKTHYLPFLSNISTEKSDFKHLTYTGCCDSLALGTEFLGIFIERYRALFSKGFDMASFVQAMGEKSVYQSLLIPCLNNSDRLQINQLDEAKLKVQVLEKMGGTIEEFNALNQLTLSSTMGQVEGNFLLIELLPEIGPFISAWDTTDMQAMSPTSVGTALAYINLKRKANINLDLGVWIK